MKAWPKTALILALCVFLLVFGIGYVYRTTDAAEAFSGCCEAPVIIIDPGHGGMDGGAVGINGALEKEINLAVSLQLADFFRFAGYPVVMTRTDDRSIHDPDAAGVRNQKTSDLHNRLAIMEEYPNGIVLSIHQNQFSHSQYSGGQVFYGSRSESSPLLAQAIQDGLKTMLQPQNNRRIKQAYDSLYLMNHAPSAAVLVECGFLSNPEEAQLLTQPDYQRRLAFTIFAATLRFLQEDTTYGNQIQNSLCLHPVRLPAAQMAGQMPRLR